MANSQTGMVGDKLERLGPYRLGGDPSPGAAERARTIKRRQKERGLRFRDSTEMVRSDRDSRQLRLLDPGANEDPPILVVDTGVAAKWYLNEPLEEEAAKVLDAGERGEVRLVAPDPIAAEFFNVLWQYHVGHRGEARSLPLEEVKSYWQEFLGAPMELFRAAPLTRRAAEIALDTGVIVYDAIFLALAEVGEAVLVTADERTILKRIEDTPYKSLGVHLANVDSLIASNARQAQENDSDGS